MWMLEDLYLAKNYNAQGKVYGFVCYSNVKNVEKLTKALNDISLVLIRSLQRLLGLRILLRRGGKVSICMFLSEEKV